ncbi:hypothetical protein RCOM_0863820 [Ricinus communis]|uniref:RNase H type-1 domain-containing protein n=1 Tax=Ricinus communis TaxID=3988 RepID=B9SA85_RICCO|nr:hypothetical protein RCOM_0863820 [Ricinus communis]
MGFRKLLVEVDNECLVHILHNQAPATLRNLALFNEAKRLLSRDWDVQLSHIYREANGCADKFANLGYGLPVGCHILQGPPDIVKDLIMQDVAYWGCST